MNNLAGVYHAIGQLDRAQSIYEKILPLVKACLGADHPHTLLTMNNLAAVHRDAGDLNLALPLYEETLRLTEAKLGAGHPQTLLTVYNLATAYHGAGQPQLALSHLYRAAAGVENLDFQHEFARGIVKALIHHLERLSRFDAAEEWQRKWLAAVQKYEGGSPTHAHELVELGWNLLQQEKWDDAEGILRECLALYERNAPTISWRS